MKRLAFALVFLFGFAPPVWADFHAGIDAYHRGDHAAALREWRPLAEQGHATAQYNLGLMYDKGQGVPQDYTEALKWYRRAAEQGDASAQFNVGTMYDKGQGVPQDYTEALRWYGKAAEQGHAYAQTNLGLMYSFGRGVPQNYVQAHKWYNLSTSRLPSGEDRDLAVKNRDIVAPKMTAAQIAEAQRLARNWKPKTQTAKTVSKSLGEPPDASSETVKSIQVFLAELGYKPGLVDGILGAQTRSTIEAYQRDQGLPVTGEASRKLKELLLWHVISKEQEGEKPKKLELSN